MCRVSNPNWEACSAGGGAGVWEERISSTGHSEFSKLLISSTDTERRKNWAENLQDKINYRDLQVSSHPILWVGRGRRSSPKASSTDNMLGRAGCPPGSLPRKSDRVAIRKTIEGREWVVSFK